ncbi:MAG: hypothetical protein ACREAU_00700 [Nitrosopumilaceae archaeon]
MEFLTDFNKTIQKLDGVSSNSEPPRWWFSTGNHVLNKVISGSFLRGIPQGRVTLFAGPSSSGKSFLTGNVVRQAQKEGAFVLIVDSENALDDDFMGAISVDVKNNYYYTSVTTINQMQKVISSFIKGYKAEYGTNIDAPKVLIGIDSLSMLMTDTELEHYEKGDQKGDMGQKNKQLKTTMRGIAQDIKELNISIVVTSQVYRNQDLMNGEGVWIIPDALRYSASQIILLTKLKLKQTGSSVVDGIRMKAEGYKTRFTKPFQTVTIEVPYDTGMDSFNGLLDVAVEMGIIKQMGGWFALNGSDKKWRQTDFAIYAEDILVKAESQRAKYLEAVEEDIDESKEISAKLRRKEKFESTSISS